VVKERIFTKLNIYFKKLFRSRVKSEYEGSQYFHSKVVCIVVEEVIEIDSIYQPKSCLHRDLRVNLREIQYITEKLFISWLKSEYIRNLIDQTKSCLFPGWRGYQGTIQYIGQKVIYIIVESKYIRKSIHHWKVVYIAVEEVIKKDSIYQLKSCLHRGWRVNIHESNDINQKVVCIAVEEVIDRWFNISIKKLFSSWLKM
jgi:hypothetical protein